MNFALSLSVVLPLCIYILIGIFSKRFGLLDPETTSKMNNFLFKTMFPVIMFQNVYNAGSQLNGSNFGLLGFMLVFALAVFVLLVILVPVFEKDGRRRPVIIQGCFRANSILFALPVVTALCGEEHVGPASICVAVLVPIYNILSVVIFEVYRGGKVSVGNMIKKIITNPLIIGAIAGAIVYLLHITLPAPVAKAVSTLSSMTTPMALIILGAGLTIGSIRRDTGALVIISVIKLIVIPAAAVLIGRALGYSGIQLVTAFSITCVPTAVSSYSMAVAMEGDGELAGEVVAFTTLASLFTVFLWVNLLSAVGIV